MLKTPTQTDALARTGEPPTTRRAIRVRAAVRARRRRIVGVLVGAPLLFGCGYLGASAASMSEPPDVIELPMVLDMPLVAVVACDGTVSNDGVPGGGLAVSPAVAGLAGEEGDAVAEPFDGCATLSARDVALPLEILAVTAA